MVTSGRAMSVPATTHRAMTSSSTRHESTRPTNQLGRRTAAWLFLAGVGNLIVLAVPFTLTLSPIGVRWDDFVSAASPFVLPVYSPALLFFGLILTVLERTERSDSADPGEEAEARYLIGNSIRISLVVALSFGSLMVLLEPTAVALVLSAALVSFIAIVRAELIAPPRTRTREEIYRRALATQHTAERSAALALGNEWAQQPVAARPRLSVVLLFAIPIVLPTAVIVVAAAIVWDPALALTAKFIVMSVVLMFGPAMLVLAWLSAADKSDSRRGRAWRVGFLVAMSIAATLSLSSAFLASGPDWAWVGVVVLTSALMTALALWSPRPSWMRERRRRLERKWTSARIARLTKWTTTAKTEWDKERVPLPLGVRILARTIRPFRQAYRLSGQEG